jgi:2-hydroxy-3-keto-5-methylthiopentenyl-1-phosphate phosphatase
VLSESQTVYFCDFDGTIAVKDVGDELHKRFSGPQWHVPNQAYREGQIGSRDCLWAQYEFFRAERSEVEAFVLEHELDPAFPEFYRWALEMQCPVVILSDGLDYYIRLLLGKYGLPEPAIFSNHAVFEGDRVRVEFPHHRPDCVHGCSCGNCKPSHIEPYEGRRRVLIGDGISDRHAAKTAEVVYAKRKLAEYCTGDSLAFTPFESFSDVLGREQARLTDEKG